MSGIYYIKKNIWCSGTSILVSNTRLLSFYPENRFKNLLPNFLYLKYFPPSPPQLHATSHAMNTKLLILSMQLWGVWRGVGKWEALVVMNLILFLLIFEATRIDWFLHTQRCFLFVFISKKRRGSLVMLHPGGGDGFPHMCVCREETALRSNLQKPWEFHFFCHRHMWWGKNNCFAI